jgi:hypothetical protein
MIIKIYPSIRIISIDTTTIEEICARKKLCCCVFSVESSTLRFWAEGAHGPIGYLLTSPYTDETPQNKISTRYLSS